MSDSDAANETLTKRVFDKKKKKTIPRIIEEIQLSTDIINSLPNLLSSLMAS